MAGLASEADLEHLPVDTVILDARQAVWQKHPLGLKTAWYCVGDERSADIHHRPREPWLVLWTPADQALKDNQGEAP